jgi:glutamine synthetase
MSEEPYQKLDYALLFFTDLPGNIRGRTVPASQLEEAFERGLGFDGSSIPFERIENSDMVMKPIEKTRTPLPDYFYDHRVVMYICRILRPGGKVFKSDPRYICEKITQKLKEEGFKPYAAPEIEFYLVKGETGNPEPVESHIKDHQRYFDLTPGRDLTESYRMDLCDALTEMGLTIEREGHEVGTGQNEITFKYSTPVKTSDNTMLYKFAAKAVAQKKYGWIATFMPKPWSERTGSGMHTHLSLFDSKGKKNLFFDSKGYANISQICRYFIGGLLKHARALCAIVAPTVNSYKRLVPGYEAPVYITWSRRNRSALVRVPEYFPGNEKGARIEFRAPDPLCNP